MGTILYYVTGFPTPPSKQMAKKHEIYELHLKPEAKSKYCDVQF